MGKTRGWFYDHKLFTAQGCNFRPFPMPINVAPPRAQIQQIGAKSFMKTHSLIAALIKSPWWKMLSFLCLYKIKTCQIAVCNNLLWWNEIIVYHFTIVDLSTMVKWNQRHHFTIVDKSTMVKWWVFFSLHHSRLLYTVIWQVFIL